jgi:hypothetical protein
MDNTKKHGKENLLEEKEKVDKEKGNDNIFMSFKGSLDPSENLYNNEDKDQQSEPQSYGYRGRIARQVTINAHHSSDNRFYKVIIPYNFDDKKYIINPKEVEFYENKRYLIEKLKFFNSNETFDIDKDFNPKPMQKVCLYVPFFIISIIVLYLTIVLSALFSFNIVVMFTLGTWIKKGYNSLQLFKFLLIEKFKIKEIHKLLDQENNSEFCTGQKLKWILGQSGYWLEVQKLVE